MKISKILLVLSCSLFSLIASANEESNEHIESAHYYDDYFKSSIICRWDWNARAPNSGMVKDPIKSKFAIHHSAGNSNPSAATVREIQRMHMDKNGWSDCGYHFFIGKDGSCFEGRELKWQGAHVEGDNKGNIGICFLGCFDTSQDNYVEPSQEMVERAGELIGVLAHHFSLEPSSKIIKGHKEHKNAHTLCPGDEVILLKQKIINKAIKTKKEIS